MAGSRSSGLARSREGGFYLTTVVCLAVDAYTSCFGRPGPSQAYTYNTHTGTYTCTTYLWGFMQAPIIMGRASASILFKYLPKYVS